MRDLEDEKRIKEYMKAKMAHIKMYNECMNLADGLDIEKFAELVRVDERAKREWIGLTDDEIVGMTCECVGNGTFNMDCARDYASWIEAKLKEKNT